jgi:hypothetical protein
MAEVAKTTAHHMAWSDTSIGNGCPSTTNKNKKIYIKQNKTDK